MLMNPILSDFKTNACYRIDENRRMIGIAFSKINDETLWQKPNAASNALGNQILHLCGNLTQYVVAALGASTDTRERNLEFSADGGWDVEALLTHLDQTLENVKNAIGQTDTAEWMRMRHVQGFHLSGLGAVFHAVEHFSYHTGQIAFWVKQITGKPLGFYDGMDLNTRNES